MSNIKGGKGLHGPDKQQDALRDVRSGAYDKGGPSKAPDPSEGQRTQHQRAQWGADVRQGVPMPTPSIRTRRICPRACLAREWAPWTRTPDEVTSSARANAILLGAVEQLPQGRRCLGPGTRGPPRRFPMNEKREDWE